MCLKKWNLYKIAHLMQLYVNVLKGKSKATFNVLRTSRIEICVDYNEYIMFLYNVSNIWVIFSYVISFLSLSITFTIRKFHMFLTDW